MTVADPTAEELEALLALQETDSRLRRVEHQLDELPEQAQLEQAEAHLAELGRQEDDLRIEAERVGAEQRQYEREVDVLRERLEHEQARMYDGSVTNPRELQSLRAEIDSTQRRIAEHEDELLTVLERAEELEARRRALQEGQETTRSRVAELTVARDTAAKELLAERGELQAQRVRQAAEVPEELRQRYEAMADKLGGTAVGRLDGNSCTACRIEMSMADVGELMDGPPLTTCPQCRRLLVVL